MSKTQEAAEELQRNYYTATADRYNHLHVHENDEHFRALRHVSAIMTLLDIQSILDVGSGTGRAVAYLLDRHPHTSVRGIEPVSAMIDQAMSISGIPAGVITCERGESLPFENGSLDAACEFGVLHHVQKPERVVREMMRVARKAVFLSDNNRFGHGNFFSRLTKLALYKAGVWSLAYRAKTRFKGYDYTEQDGLSYSYSVYDSYDELAKWADRIIIIPTGRVTSRHWAHPLLNCGHVLLCALRDVQ